MHPASEPADTTPASTWRSHTTGIILAGGAGRRMRGRDKGLVSWEDQPLVWHAANSLRPLVSDLLLSCNRNVERYRKIVSHVIADNRGGFQGPLAGLEAARDRVATPLLLVSPCDMPGMPGDVFATLLQTLAGPGKPRRDAVFLRSGGRSHYLCLALRREALTGLADYLDSGQRSVRDWLATLDTGVLVMDVPGEQLRNINALPPDR